MAFQVEQTEQPVNEPTVTPVENLEKLNSSGLNEKLKFRVQLCDVDGKLLEESTEEVACIALSGEKPIESQYSTPFENSNPEHRLPTLMGQLQSGEWLNTLDAVVSAIPFLGKLSDEQKNQLGTLTGRSNLTKVNSVQVFTSTASIHLPMTLLFEAWADAKTEVEEQISLLEQWALPEQLSKTTAAANLAQDFSLDSIFPSLVPPFVAVSYGGKRYAPMLIQSVSAPIVAPMDRDGNRLIIQVSATFISRTAWDKQDIINLYSGIQS
ncbi:hypothetical protein DJ533_00310 (plasmid) [Acinetobacter defluvii]|uniref:Uncharacterized protein n=1 Tax=Acinetobacter defluvii TaxID=1871111 RepID=A0A2S2F850_9GAMM|nr:hypothetical protein [Acinetobacter defluvii]AWL27161.1 hypothetical protein DJ533_00310 [Acinetobacter defluvii]